MILTLEERKAQALRLIRNNIDCLAEDYHSSGACFTRGLLRMARTTDLITVEERESFSAELCKLASAQDNDVSV